MSWYRRAKLAGGTFFFTVALADRRSDLRILHIDRLRRIYSSVRERRPFETVAICVLPDHLHAIWSLPETDADFASRWMLIKTGFSRGLPAAATRSTSKVARREKGLWQRRYWEHAIRDGDDLARHVDYIHFNPVKHGHVGRVRDWPYSSFHRYCAKGLLPTDWGGDIADATGEFGE
ncbi:transposase [Rhodoplanes sp. TEM]|uniref:Transposase n=1 Tax=Rhodoplanes tepidamans TaxID=200616 RepID=A0ABT5JD18_RHOTP|nr:MULTISPECIES: transposase [Rhodoplanes]MDC7787517.1 transposase [Rhodoplanes tepidamans]MDC7983892.1 transposase [Rhodoplanes sp. TEM]MDQ0354330.1 putative transposase [Rhodoplanes tepidamans]